MLFQLPIIKLETEMEMLWTVLDGDRHVPPGVWRTTFALSGLEKGHLT